jgi:hypothetical protein
VVSGKGKKDGRGNTFGPNRDRLTVGVDLGDRWSQSCILGLEGETLAEGQVRTRGEDVGEFFRGLTTARVVVEVGTHSAWVQDVITELGHEVLVANPRLMEGRSVASARVIASMRTSWRLGRSAKNIDTSATAEDTSRVARGGLSVSQHRTPFPNGP